MKRIYIGIVLGLIFITLGVVLSYKEGEIQVQRDIKENTELVMEDRVIGDIEGLLIDEEIYLPISFFREYLFQDIEIYKDNKRALIDLTNIEFELETDELTDYVKDNNVQINIPITVKNNKQYLPTKALSRLLKLKIDYNEESQIITIDKYHSDIIVGKIKVDKAKVKLDPSTTSFTISELVDNEEVRVFEEVEEWYKIRTALGYIGFMHKNDLETYEKSTDLDNRLNNIRYDMDKNEKINITWEYVYEKTPDISGEDRIEGLDVVSPTCLA